MTHWSNRPDRGESQSRTLDWGALQARDADPSAFASPKSPQGAEPAPEARPRTPVGHAAQSLAGKDGGSPRAPTPPPRIARRKERCEIVDIESQ